MFTGIVQGTAAVIKIIEKEKFRTHIIKLSSKLVSDLQIGASVAHNGCCLTVTAIDDQLVSFDLMQATLELTNLGELRPGDEVNIERAAKIGDEIGGHLMSGHIMCTATIINIIQSDNNYQIWFELPPHFKHFIFNKGFIGIDGISLTISEVNNNQFSVNLIPETLKQTTIGQKQLGNRVNIEIDPQTQAIVETVERILANRQ